MDYHDQVWTRLAAVSERLWSNPPHTACERGAVRRRLRRAMAHIRHEHYATATGPSALERPEVVPPENQALLSKVGPLPKCPSAKSDASD